jgi:hypothetical protein
MPLLQGEPDDRQLVKPHLLTTTNISGNDPLSCEDVRRTKLAEGTPDADDDDGSDHCSDRTDLLDLGGPAAHARSNPPLATREGQTRPSNRADFS